MYNRIFNVFLFVFLVGLTASSAAFADVNPLDTKVFENNNFNDLFERATISFGGFSGLAASVAYILGVLAAFSALLKLKEVIDEPARVPLRDPFIRIIFAGSMFALPTAMNLLTATFGGQSGDVEGPGLILASAGNFFGAVTCKVAGAGGGLGGALFNGLVGGTLSSLICNSANSFVGLTGLLNVILYLSGIVLTIWGLVQLKDHVIDPRSVPLATSLKKLAVAGIFFSFPAFIEIVYNTFAGDSILVGTDIFGVIKNVLNFLGGGGGLPGSCGNGAAALGGALGGVIAAVGNAVGGNKNLAVGGLDCMFIRLIGDISGPLQAATSLFCYLAGLIMIIMAVRRIMESTDKGARGPLGTGTFAMLAIGGMLLSFNTILATITGSLFPSILNVVGVGMIQQQASLTYTAGLDAAGVSSINSVLSSVLGFAFLLGMFSVLRGLFILRDVADGGGNASIMAGMTHVIAGGMAINLGPLISAVQNTLGLQNVGLSFS